MDRKRADHVLSVELPANPPELSAESARILLEILFDAPEDTEVRSAAETRIVLRQQDEEAVGR